MGGASPGCFGSVEPRESGPGLTGPSVLFDPGVVRLRRAAPAAAMPGIEKLPIEETLEDSPQVAC